MNLQIVFFCLFSFTLWSQNFTAEQLLGKDNSFLVKTENYQLQEEVATAFEKMKKAAEKEGIEIQIISSYRSFESQKRIWNRKYKLFTETEGMSPEEALCEIITYSSIPGTSRHHWGTEIDIVDGSKEPQGEDVLLEEFFYNEGPYVPLRVWLKENAADFGFYLTYTNDEDRKGFLYEPWHYSYAPISKKMYTDYFLLEIIPSLKEESFLGTTYFSDDFLEKYIGENISGINSELIEKDL